MFKILARIKVILPSFSKQQMDLAKAKKMANNHGYYYVTTRALR
jgi:hypothetical protein